MTFIHNLVIQKAYRHQTIYMNMLYKYGPVMRAIWSFMNRTQSRGQYCCRRSIKPILPDIIGQYLLIICQIIVVQAHWSIHIARFLIIFDRCLFYSLGHDATIVTSQCTSDTMVTISVVAP